MTAIVYRCFVLLAFVAFLGCGDSGNQVVVDPVKSPEEEQRAYEDYDKQMEQSVPNP